MNDPTDEVFVPKVDLSNKPWFDPGVEVPTVRLEAARNLSRAVASIPLETRRLMGYTLPQMLQQCLWEGLNCGPR